MKLNLQGIRDAAAYREAGIELPRFDISAMRKATAEAPAWIHFGAGNIFRAFPCAALSRLLDEGRYDRGVIAAETYDGEIVGRAYKPFDNLSLLAVLRADGRIDKRVVASVAEAVSADAEGLGRMEAVFRAPSLQMASLTVTEKAYAPGNPLMALLANLLRIRFDACAAPIAVVSMDNCAHNGEKLRAAMLPAAMGFVDEGKAPAEFLEYFVRQVAFPNSMIDKITPHPAQDVADMLGGLGFEDAVIIKTAKGTVTAAFVNAEQAEYLVIEDDFPNGRPPLEKAGIVFTDRATVDRVEKMKVGTCLNPLHTALAVLGCLLGYTRICAEMDDPDLKKFVERLGYVESLPVVEDPVVLSPKAFLDEVLTRRLNNPFLPDTPQRIATDTSAKLSVRFGWTIAQTADKRSLRCVPFVFAAWLRYLTGIDDEGNAFTPSPDPRLAEVRGRMAQGLSDELLSDASLFGADLVENGMAEAVRALFGEMMQGKGAVRKALRKIIA